MSQKAWIILGAILGGAVLAFFLAPSKPATPPAPAPAPIDYSNPNEL